MDVFIVFLVIIAAVAVAATVRAWMLDGLRRTPSGLRRDGDFGWN